ncbi:ATPase, T2SS/T4P/T4SS family [Kiritimatiellaeota bacterium B1221]|nr:ATPase, T2SS/T4P/T4SS family [Kiritimatiellaeota bacterium B1221]
MSELTHIDQLLDHLLQHDYISEAQANDVLDEHNRTGRSVRQIILDMEIMTEDDLLEQMALLMGVRVLDLERHNMNMDLARKLPSSVARMYNLVPVNIDAVSIELATCDFVPPEVVDELRFVLAMDVEFVISRERDIKDHLVQFYAEDSDDSVGHMLSELESELEDAGEVGGGTTNLTEEDLSSSANAAPVIRYVNLVLYQAVQDRASDIHFEPFEHEFKIRYRVDGALYEMAPPPKHLALPVISRIKVMSGLDISERRLPQDGRIQLNIAGRPVDFRVSTLPTQFGESVVLRVLDQSAVGLEMERLGMPDDVYNNFSEDIMMPNGIILVTGPTGSGKTTTLYAALGRRNEVGVKILTAEEPVEYDIDGIVQINANHRINLTFGSILRAFLRQDPDVILVGEIRDLETAQIAIQASLTGHLVFSTLHTNDSSGAVTRMVDMGLEPFLIASTLQSVMGTRLVRTICKECRTPFIPDDLQIKSLGLTREVIGNNEFYYGAGCENCHDTGYHGRRGIYEYLKVTDPIRTMITERRPTVVLRDRARELGMRTLREDGIRCILDGFTTIEEIIKYT